MPRQQRTCCRPWGTCPTSSADRFSCAVECQALGKRPSGWYPGRRCILRLRSAAYPLLRPSGVRRLRPEGGVHTGAGRRAGASLPDSRRGRGVCRQAEEAPPRLPLEHRTGTRRSLRRGGACPGLWPQWHPARYPLKCPPLLSRNEARVGADPGPFDQRQTILAPSTCSSSTGSFLPSDRQTSRTPGVMISR